MRRTRRQQLRALGPALLRAVRWQPVPVAVLGAVLLLWWQHDPTAEPSRALWLLRAVALLLAVSLAFALDDRTRATLAAVPTPQWWRSVVALFIALAPACLAWAAVLGWVQLRSAGAVPAAALSLEAAALAALVLSVAGGLARWRRVGEPGVVAGPVVLAVGLMLPQLPGRVALAVLPGPGWDAAHARWTVLLVTAAAVLAISLRDPAAPGPRLLGRLGG